MQPLFFRGNPRVFLQQAAPIFAASRQLNLCPSQVPPLPPLPPLRGRKQKASITTRGFRDLCKPENPRRQLAARPHVPACTRTHPQIPTESHRHPQTPTDTDNKRERERATHPDSDRERQRAHPAHCTLHTSKQRDGSVRIICPWALPSKENG